jgi:DNA-binding NtrC family response regulator
MPDADEVVNLAEWEKIMIARAVAKYGVSVEGKRKAAQALGISLSTLYEKLKRYGWSVRQELDLGNDFRK